MLTKLADLKMLAKLDLSQNRIDSIACGAFLRNLKILDLSLNKPLITVDNIKLCSIQ